MDDFKVDEAGDLVMTGTAMRALGLANSATAKLKRARVTDGDWDHAAPMYLVPQEILRNILSSLTALQAQYDQMMSLGGQPSPGTGSSISEEAMPSALPPRVLESHEADIFSYSQQAGHCVKELASIIRRRTILADLEAVHLSNLERILASMVTPPPHGKVETAAHPFADDREEDAAPAYKKASATLPPTEQVPELSNVVAPLLQATSCCGERSKGSASFSMA